MTPSGLPAQTLAKLIEVFCVHPALNRVVLFGSRAKGNHRAGSDIDLALIGDELSVDDLFRIETGIDELLLPYQVDLVLAHQIDNADLAAHIERVGVEIYRRPA